MKNVIIETEVQYQLSDLKDKLINTQGDKKGHKTFNEIISVIDNLEKYDIGTNLKDKYNIDCPDNWFLLYVKQNYFIFSRTKTEVNVLKMYSNKQDFLFHLFGISMRSQDSIDYWGD